VAGIGGHSKGRRGIAEYLETERALTLEATVVSLSDRVAYLNHDLDDCLSAGLIHPEDLPEECVGTLGARYSQRISTMVSDIIEQSEGEAAIRLSPQVASAVDALKEFMYERVYHAPPMAEERRRVRMVIESLFRLYMTSDDALAAALGQLPPAIPERARAVCDYIAGMTDRYATDRYVESFLPGSVAL
jgi:dGTPase